MEGGLAGGGSLRRVGRRLKATDDDASFRRVIGGDARDGP